MIIALLVGCSPASPAAPAATSQPGPAQNAQPAQAQPPQQGQQAPAAPQSFSAGAAPAAPASCNGQLRKLTIGVSVSPPNVVHTPHNAGRTIDANRRWAEMLAAQFRPRGSGPGVQAG